MPEPQTLAELMERINQRTLKEILDDTWSRYFFKLFIRVSRPHLTREPFLIKRIKSYEVTLKLLNDSNNYKDHANNLMERANHNWKILFKDMQDHDKTYNEYARVTQRYQNELIRDILASHEYFEFKQHVQEAIATRTFN